jgi:hypothetical protein
MMVNGSELVRGLRMTLPEGTVVTGGLAADGDRFGETVVLAGDRVESGLAVALALWPGLDLASRRSLVVALLVWSAGGLVWLNAAGRSALGPLALLISGLLWGVMQAWPALANLLALAPLDGALVPQLLGLAAVLLLAFGLEQRRCPAADLVTGWSRCRVQ